MASTIEVLKSESDRLRKLADRVDALICDLASVAPVATVKPRVSRTVQTQTSGSTSNSEYAGLTQTAAVLKALGHGPQTTRELFMRLNAGGLALKQPTYVTSILARLKAQTERVEGRKIKLRGTT